MTYTVPFWIDGAEHTPEKTFEVRSPATGEVVHLSGGASEADAKAAVDAAAKALPSWKKTTPAQRRDIFLKAAEILAKRNDELSKYLVDETGGAPQWGGFNLMVAGDFLKDVGGRIPGLAGSVPAASDPNLGAVILKEPFGVVLAIAPWNAPYILGMRAVLFPIAAGNTVVLKGSEFSPRVFWAIASVFHEAGLPKGVLNFLAHDPKDAAAVTQALIAHSEVKKVNFTGSTAVGRIIGKLAGEHLKPVILELGGKAPAIVWEDADLDIAAEQCALGSFLHAGQICMSTEKILVHKNIRKDFEAKFVEKVGVIFPNKSDAPVLINGAAVEKNKKLLKDAVGKGASILTGDPDVEESTKTRMRPIIVSGVSQDMDLYNTESFGPTVSVIEIETEEEALKLANDTPYGLSSAVFTEDLRRGLRFAKEIEAGAVHINNMTVHDEAGLPHGGAKASGYGRFNTSLGLDEWVRTKTVTWRS